MTNSYKKTQRCGNAADSDKKWKRRANRKYRRLVKSILAQELEPVIPGPDAQDLDPILPELREVTNVYDSDKDGKSYFGLDKSNNTLSPEDIEELKRK